MSKSSQTASNTLLLRRQLAELTKRPVEGFSAGAHVSCFPITTPNLISTGLVDENNLYEWEIMIIGYVASTLLLHLSLTISQPSRHPLVSAELPLLGTGS